MTVMVTQRIQLVDGFRLSADNDCHFNKNLCLYFLYPHSGTILRTVNMTVYNRDYRYDVELNIHAIDAPGVRLPQQGYIYLNVCLLGVHKRTRLMPAHLPMHIDQKLYFDKVNQ
jgi:hypothetical protein